MPDTEVALTPEQMTAQNAAVLAEKTPAQLKQLMAELQKAYLPTEEARCASDGWYWVRHHVKTRDEAAGADKSVMPFPGEPALEAIWGVLQHSPSKLIVIAKSRQIMVSWVTCAYALWRARFYPNRQIVWQTKKEDDAKDMVSYGADRLDEARMQFIESHLPGWMAKKRRFRDGQIIYDNGSKIVAVPEGGNQVRSKTTSLVVIDEAAFQDQFRSAMTAALPLLNKESRMVAISTANGRNAFWEAYQKGVEGGRVIYSSRGVTIWENSETEVTSIRVHYTAFPDRDPQNADPAKAAIATSWRDKQRKRYLTQNAWDQEMEISFDVTQGKRVYPTFEESTHILDPDNCDRYGCQTTPMRRRKLLRSWDFGWHHPAVIIGQVDTRDRLILYGELQGADVDIDRFAQNVIDYCAETFGDWSAWGYEDYCDPAGAQVRSIMSEKNENTELQVLARYGIHPTYAPKPRRVGRAIIHQLLARRDDGRWEESNGTSGRLKGSPALLVTRACPLIISGMLGGYSYKAKPDGMTFHEEPDDEGYYSHTQACLRYMATNRFGNLGDSIAPVLRSLREPKFGSNSRGGY